MAEKVSRRKAQIEQLQDMLHSVGLPANVEQTKALEALISNGILNNLSDVGFHRFGGKVGYLKVTCRKARKVFIPHRNDTTKHRFVEVPERLGITFVPYQKAVSMLNSK